MFKLVRAQDLLVAPTFFEALRIQQGTLGAYEDDGFSGVAAWARQDVENQLMKAGTIGSIFCFYFPGRISQVRHLPSAFRGGMSAGQLARMYGGNLLPFPTIGGIRAWLYNQAITVEWWQGWEDARKASTTSIAPSAN